MCTTKPTLQEPVKDPARLEWHEVTKVAHYYLPACAVLGTADRSVNALSACEAQAGMTRPDLPAGRQVQVREDEAPYGKDG